MMRASSHLPRRACSGAADTIWSDAAQTGEFSTNCADSRRTQAKARDRARRRARRKRAKNGRWHGLAATLSGEPGAVEEIAPEGARALVEPALAASGGKLIVH